MVGCRHSGVDGLMITINIAPIELPAPTAKQASAISASLRKHLARAVLSPKQVVKVARSEMRRVYNVEPKFVDESKHKWIEPDSWGRRK